MYKEMAKTYILKKIEEGKAHHVIAKWENSKETIFYYPSKIANDKEKKLIEFAKTLL